MDERSLRLVLAADATTLGHGGIVWVARAAGVAQSTVSRGVTDLESGPVPVGRVRLPGAGRRPLTETDPGLLPALLALVDPDSRGDPESPMRWTVKSTRTLADELTGAGHPVSPNTVGRLLRDDGFSPQGTDKTLEGRQSPDRDAQFGHVNERAREFLDAGEPVVSVDCKKKELVGRHAVAGRTWRPKGNPVPTSSHGFFAGPGDGKALPYGVYDLAADSGWVSVGTDHDTAAFAVATLTRWWQAQGAAAYPGARRLLVTADGGGSNGHRTRLWKVELAAFAAATGLEVTVCHFPPGTSKWNRIEHRLFSHISMNWAGQPLTSHEAVVQLVGATTTRTGLRVHAELDPASYPLGVTVTDDQLAALPLTRHDWHGEWNYTLAPTGPAPQPAAPPAPPRPDRSHLAVPALTGLTPTAWQTLLARAEQPRRAQREATLYLQRGGHDRQHRPGHRPPRLDDTDRILATALDQRFGLPQAVVGTLFGVGRVTINITVRETRQLLAQLGHTFEPTGTRLTTLDELAAHTGVTLAPNQDEHPPDQPNLISAC